LVVPASIHENRASELMLEHLAGQGVAERLELVLVDRCHRTRCPCARPKPRA
jgi:putative transposase